MSATWASIGDEEWQRIDGVRVKWVGGDKWQAVTASGTPVGPKLSGADWAMGACDQGALRPDVAAIHEVL